MATSNQTKYLGGAFSFINQRMGKACANVFPKTLEQENDGMDYIRKLSISKVEKENILKMYESMDKVLTRDSGSEHYGSGSTYAVHNGKKVVCHRVAGACHYALSVGPEAKPKLILNRVPSPSHGDTKGQLKGCAEFFYNWYLNDSPFSYMHLTKSARTAMRKGILTNTNVSGNFLGCAMISLRMPIEYKDCVVKMKKFADDGVHPNLAFLLAMACSDFGGKYNIVPFGDHHQPLKSAAMSRDGVKRFIRGELPHADDLMNETYEQSGRYRMEGFPVQKCYTHGGGPSLHLTLKAQVGAPTETRDAWGDMVIKYETKVVYPRIVEWAIKFQKEALNA